MRSQEQDFRSGLKTIGVAIQTDGTVTISGGGGEVFVNKTGTGAYSVRFLGMKSIRYVTSSLLSGGFITNNQIQPNIVNINTYTPSAVAADIAFNVVVTGIAQ